MKTRNSQDSRFLFISLFLHALLLAGFLVHWESTIDAGTSAQPQPPMIHASAVSGAEVVAQLQKLAAAQKAQEAKMAVQRQAQMKPVTQQAIKSLQKPKPQKKPIDRPTPAPAKKAVVSPKKPADEPKKIQLDANTQKASSRTNKANNSQQQTATGQDEVSTGQKASKVLSVAMQGQIADFKAMIEKAIRQQWQTDGFSNGLSCQIMIRLAPDGTVLKSEVLQSSGDAAFDASVLAAVDSAAPLPVPDDPTLFSAMRVLNLTMRTDVHALD